MRLRTSPINRALNIPRLSYGISQKAMGICWGPMALVAVFIGSSNGWIWALIPVVIGALIHSVLRWLYKKDHLIFDIYGKYSVLSNEYHPHVRENLPVPFERPTKVGRGIRL
jgi:type IV secretory pathway TrbD component